MLLANQGPNDQPPIPTLHLLPAWEQAKLEDYILLFRSLKGREPTPEEIQEAKEEMERD